MAKYHIDLIVKNEAVYFNDLFDFEKYQTKYSVFEYEKDAYQIIKGKEKENEGYLNIYKSEVQSLLEIEGMYNDETIQQINLLISNSSLYTFVFVGSFGFDLLNESLHYIDYNDKIKYKIFVLDDQGNQILPFNEFFKKHLENVFFWLPNSGNVFGSVSH